MPGPKPALQKTLEVLTIVIQSSLPAEASSQELPPVSRSHSHWRLWRQRMFRVVQMCHHGLYFSPSIAGLDALENSQTQRGEKGLQLAIPEFPREPALKDPGLLFSILSKYHRLLHSISIRSPSPPLCLPPSPSLMGRVAFWDEIIAGAQADPGERRQSASFRTPLT